MEGVQEGKALGRARMGLMGPVGLMCGRFGRISAICCGELKVSDD
jgi:hypothetical protein